jgi:hypothetical protein
LRSHPGNTIVATNKADDCTEQGGNESRNAKKAEYPEQQNTMVVNVSRDRYVEEDSKKNKTTEATNGIVVFLGAVAIQGLRRERSRQGDKNTTKKAPFAPLWFTPRTDMSRAVVWVQSLKNSGVM